MQFSKCVPFFALLVFSFCFSGNLAAQTTSASQRESRFDLESKALTPTAPVMQGVVVDKKPTRRLPNHYRSAGLSEDQQEEIYEIQRRYSPLINFLTERLDLLKAEQDAKIKAVLSSEQQMQVEKATEEAAKARRARAAANTSRTPARNSRAATPVE